MGGLPRLVEHNTGGHFECGGVEAIGHQWGEEVVDQVPSHPMYSLLYRIGGHVRARGRRL